MFKKILSPGPTLSVSNVGNSLPSSGMTPPNRVGIERAQNGNQGPKMAIRSISTTSSVRARPPNLLPDKPLRFYAEIGGRDARLGQVRDHDVGYQNRRRSRS